MVGTWSRSFPVPTKLTHYTLLNKKGVKAWAPDGPTQGRCIWEYHDLWRWSSTTNKPVILRENYFRRHPDTGKEVSHLLSENESSEVYSEQIDFYVDFYYPFALKWSERVRKLSSPDKLVLLEAIPNEVGYSSSHSDDNMTFCSSFVLHHGRKKGDRQT